MKKFVSVLIVGLIVFGLAIAIFNFFAPSLRAGGWVEKEGTFPGNRLLCPGDPDDCVHRIYVE